MQHNPYISINPGYWLSTLQAVRPPQEEVSETGQITTFVAGTRYEGRPAVVSSLQAGQTLQLVPEPTNPYDRNAVRVECLDGRRVGYIPRHLAALIAAVIHTPLQARVTALDRSIPSFGKRDVTISFSCPVISAETKGEQAYEPIESDL